jgi:hypothetical protein
MHLALRFQCKQELERDIERRTCCRLEKDSGLDNVVLGRYIGISSIFCSSGRRHTVAQR